jgi:hypothetical protein
MFDLLGLVVSFGGKHELFLFSKVQSVQSRIEYSKLICRSTSTSAEIDVSEHETRHNCA